jgi:phosphoglucomutase
MNEFARENYSRWLESSKVAQEDKDILKRMSDVDIDDAFFKNIEFGTGGMRGVLGPGINRINFHIIKRVTVGLGLFLLDKYKAKKVKVAISHDNRHHSRDFVLEIVDILNKMGIDTFIFDSLRPTPELSFAVRYLHCDAGIMITASHNPKQYNGYKVYDETGCQLVPAQIDPIIKIIDKLPNELDVEVPISKESGSNQTIGKKVDDVYVKLVEGIQLNPALDKSNFKIVYTPNHGTSFVNAMRVFKDCGYDVHPVLSQCDPDPDFSGTLSPNPEDPRSFIESIKLAKKIDADLVCMTDPDGDRVGLAIKVSNGVYRLMTGNESAAILLHYILENEKNNALLPSNGIIYNTIVTSSLGARIARNYNVKVESFLTGFKYIGEAIHHHEIEKNGPKFIFGYEESYGCLIKDFVRDKDGIQAILMYSEMALYYHLKGLTLFDVYNELAKKYGYYQSKLYSIEFKGSEGAAKMEKIMGEITTHPISSLLGRKVKIFEDYFNLAKTDFSTGEKKKIQESLRGDVVKFVFQDGSSIAVRPSGTEPKCKFYVELVGESEEKLKDTNELFYEAFLKIYQIK